MFADKIWGDYKFHLVILLCCVLAELVGPIRIPLGGVTITLLPLLYSMIFVLVVYLIKPIKFVKEKQAATGSAMLTLSVAFLMAKLGITSGRSGSDSAESGKYRHTSGCASDCSPSWHGKRGRWYDPRDEP